MDHNISFGQKYGVRGSYGVCKLVMAHAFMQNDNKWTQRPMVNGEYGVYRQIQSL